MHLLIDKIFNTVYNEVRQQLENQKDGVIFRKARLKQQVSLLIQELICKARSEDLVQKIDEPMDS